MNFRNFGMFTIFLAAVACGLTACGGGGPDNSPPSGASSSSSSSSSISNSEFIVKSQASTVWSQTKPLGLAGGNFVLGWIEMADSETGHIRLQEYSPFGGTVGSSAAAGDIGSFINSRPQLSLLSSGKLLVGWHREYGTPVGSSRLGNDNIWAQTFTSLAAAGDTIFQVNLVSTQPHMHPALAGLVGGGYVVAWDDYDGVSGDYTTGTDVKAQLFSAANAPLGTSFAVNSQLGGQQTNPAIAPLSNGGFVVVWEDASGTSADATGLCVKAQVFAADGTRLGSELLVNSNTLGDQKSPRVAALTGGGFVVVWQDASASLGDASGTGIHGQVFAADGSKQGTEFLVNTTTAQDQSAPDISGLSTGGFVVVWQDASQAGGDTGLSAIRLQAYTATATKNGQEVLVNTPSALTKIAPMVGKIANGGYVVDWKTFTGSLGATGSTEYITARVFGS